MGCNSPTPVIESLIAAFWAAFGCLLLWEIASYVA